MKKKIDAMHSLYGFRNDICANCSHLVECSHRDRNYFKCEIYGESNSEATDWRKKYIACGLFNKETPIRNVYKTLSRDKPLVVLDGQETFLTD